MVDWVELGVEVMRDARKRQGLSYETMGRKLSVSAKTYERYEKSGRAPRQLLPRIAEVLDLEIETPTRTRVAVKDPDEDPGTTARQLSDLRESIDRIETMLRDRLGEPPDERQSA